MAIVFALAVVLMPSAQAQTYNVLHNFTGGLDGADPVAGLTIDGAGNLYGTTYAGGSANNGVVFKLAHKGTGFVFNTLHSFEKSNDGTNPYAKVTIARDSSLYGTTFFGVPGTGCGMYGCGTVFNLKLPPTACKSALCPWSESIAYQFPDGEMHGVWPLSAVIFDQSGNMFGTAIGNNLPGIAFELMPSGSGWIQSVICKFADLSTGTQPEGDLIRDRAGNLYGVTFTGGVNDDGVVYQLVPSGSGWTENVIHSFDHTSDGANPAGGLILDKDGNLYGTTGGNGGWGVGTVFMLSAGTWNETVLHNFARNENPGASLKMDADGNIYGTTLAGGMDRGGTIFKMTPSSDGWTYNVLKEFDSPCNDGCFPMSNVAIDASGKNLYGTTSGGGTHGQGVIWEITLP